ncbi:HNH endonuclease [Streptomyces chartreusis]
MTGRRELTEYRYRQARAQVLSTSDTCIWCGHPGADSADHIIPVSKGGDPYALDNLGPIHGVKGCGSCGRKCNNDKGDKLPSEYERLRTSVDWYA